MNRSETGRRATGAADRSALVLAMLALFSCAVYAGLALVSLRFRYGVPASQKPILGVLALLAAACAAYFAAMVIVRRAPATRAVLGVIVASAVAFRVILLASHPIQEVDIYRYVWDGAVVLEGVSPYRYTPQQVRDAPATRSGDERLDRLTALREADASLATVLDRIHFGELPTVYPPVSQAVFTAVAATTPAGASVWGRVTSMKTALVLFDLATIALVVGLLRAAGRSANLCLVYAWCPLLMKEIANSGHLDSIAVFLTTLAAYLAARLLDQESSRGSGRRGARDLALACASAAALALAVGAKLYPLALAPLGVVFLARRLGWRRMGAPAAIFAAASVGLVAPMLLGGSGGASSARTDQGALVEPGLGLKTFLRRWEMNDFLFLLAVENLKPAGPGPAQTTAWFSVAPASFRERVVERTSGAWGVDRSEAPFLAARAVTGLAFLLTAGVLAWRVRRSSNTADWLEAAFLTVAWFWLLCPTQNPWYWTWVLPFLPLARGRAWSVMSGLVFLYYLRFWLVQHWPDSTVLGGRYDGASFFDFVVTWIEFAPWFVWLGVGWLLGRGNPRGDGPTTSDAPNSPGLAAR